MNEPEIKLLKSIEKSLRVLAEETKAKKDFELIGSRMTTSDLAKEGCLVFILGIVVGCMLYQLGIDLLR